MASGATISYQRLRNEGGFDDVEERSGRVIGRAIRRWSRRYRKVELRRRKVKISIPSLKKFLRGKAKVIVGSWSNVFQSFSQFGDLFAGNYLFMQVTPTALPLLNILTSLIILIFTSTFLLGTRRIS